MSPQRIISANEAQRQHHLIEWRAEQKGSPCISRATFPDGVHQCAKDDSHVDEGVWHQNEAQDHRWSIETSSDGEPMHGMVKP